VICLASPPPIGSLKICRLFPTRELRKYRNRESGDQRTSAFDPVSANVIWRGSPPLAETTQTLVTDLFLSTSLRVTVNATVAPSGDMRGPPTRASFCMSST
jgi:hypothetical protein